MDFGGYVYNEPTAIQELIVLPGAVEYLWSVPSEIQELVVATEVEYLWSAPSLIQTLNITNLSEVIEPVIDTIYYNRTVRVSVVFPEAVKARAALEDIPYDNMPYLISDVAKASHVAVVTLPPESEGDQTLFIKTANPDDSPAIYMSIAAFGVARAPTGKDTRKLLRLRKFFKDGNLERWHGKLAVKA